MEKNKDVSIHKKILYKKIEGINDEIKEIHDEIILIKNLFSEYLLVNKREEELKEKQKRFNGWIWGHY